MLIRTLALKIINNERKVLRHHGIIDQLWIHRNIWRPNISSIHLLSYFIHLRSLTFVL